MKGILLSFAFLVFNYPDASAQVRDSICLWDIGNNPIREQGIRKLRRAEFNAYRVNDKLFRKKLKNDSLYVEPQLWKCIPASVFVGEYLSSDSIHYLDYVKCRPELPLFSLNGICEGIIHKDQLKEITEIRIGTVIPDLNFVSCEMYIKIDSTVCHFTLTDTVLPQKVKEIILTLHEGDLLVFDNIKVMHQGSKRTIENPPGYMIKD